MNSQASFAPATICRPVATNVVEDEVTPAAVTVTRVTVVRSVMLAFVEASPATVASSADRAVSVAAPMSAGAMASDPPVA